jgi:hypothetical protein
MLGRRDRPEAPAPILDSGECHPVECEIERPANMDVVERRHGEVHRAVLDTSLLVHVEALAERGRPHVAALLFNQRAPFQDDIKRTSVDLAGISLPLTVWHSAHFELDTVGIGFAKRVGARVPGWIAHER